MALIKDYDNTQNIQPTERGVEAVAGAARRVGSNYAEAGAALQAAGAAKADEGKRLVAAGENAATVAKDYIQNREISAGAVAMANQTASLTDRWNATAKGADPNDPTVAQKFRDEVMEPELAKLKQGFITDGGQAFAERHIEALRTHMIEKTSADMSSLAAAAVKSNMQQISNVSSNTARRDPSAVPFLLKSVDGSVGALIDSAPNLKGAAAASARMQLTEKMKEDIVKAGAIGAIQKSANPEQTAEEWGAKYPQYINGAELKTLGANARQQIRAARIDQAYAEHQQDKIKQQKSDLAEEGVLKKLYGDDPQAAASVSTKSVVNDPDMNRQAKERTINLVKRELKPETDTKISAETFSTLAQDIRAGKITDIGEIAAARSKGPGEEGSLTRADAQELRQMFIDMQTPDGSKLGRRTHDFMTAVAPQIDKSNPLMGVIDRTGKQMTYEFNQFVQSKIEEYRRDKKNVYDLFTPGKPDYLGRPEVLRAYQKPLDASMTTAVDNLRPRPKPEATVSTTKPPVPGATWSEDKKAWQVQMNGKTYTVRE